MKTYPSDNNYSYNYQVYLLTQFKRILVWLFEIQDLQRKINYKFTHEGSIKLKMKFPRLLK